MDRQNTVPNVLQKLARLLGTEIKDGRVNIPEKFGKGYCAGFVFNESIRMMIFNYELEEDLVIENPDVDLTAKMILFKFQNIFPEMDALLKQKQLKPIPSVLIATRSLGAEAVIPIHTHTATINIEIDADYLDGLIYRLDTSPVLQSLLLNTQPLLFEEIIYPSLKTIVDEIVFEPVDALFKLFFLRVKAEELVCRLLMELEKRDAKQLYALNSDDIRTIYKIRNTMLDHLDTPPLIKELSASACMSPTKLKRSFKQIFGNSIFNYYQQFRMKEAAVLLKEGRLSVAQVGYKLGFTNLSHFSKVFAAHTGIKPKQFSRL